MDRTLSLSTVAAVMNAPIENFNIGDWLLYLPDREYQRCSSAHLDETLEFFQQHGISFEKEAEARQLAFDAHNKEEIPNFAKSIERHSLQISRTAAAS